MRRATFFVPGVLALLLAVPGCGGQGTQGNRDDASERFDAHKALFGTIHEADRLVLYEGLPHPYIEPALFDKEKRSKKHDTRNGFPFYPEPLDFSADDARRVKELLGDAASFRPFVPSKCDFHPDYCVEWSAGGHVHRCLLCLGCWEVKVYGPDNGLYCHMDGELREALRGLLGKYRKNRPARQSDD